MHRHTTLLSIIATALWSIGAALICIAILTQEVEGLASAGLYIAGAGAVLTIKCMILHAVEQMRDRERNAFQLGRDAARLSSID